MESVVYISLVFYLYTAFGQHCDRFKMLPGGKVTIADNDIISVKETESKRDCAILCLNTEHCISYELELQENGNFECTLRQAFITNLGKLTNVPGKMGFYHNFGVLNHVGCYAKSSITGPRQMVANYRSSTLFSWTPSVPEDENIWSLNAHIIRTCGTMVQKTTGATVFGIEFYGECYAYPGLSSSQLQLTTKASGCYFGIGAELQVSIHEWDYFD